MQKITHVQIQEFRKKIRMFYRAHKRDLPWRKTHDPYKILVSEVMLQQTQVDRVIPKYLAFIKQFPTARRLAEARTVDVLALWSGLGYNSRALRLKRAAETIVAEYGGRVPKDKVQLVALPGIGPYTAGAIRTFAYDLPDEYLETNIRTVFIHEFFSTTKRQVSDSELIELVRMTLPARDWCGWYSALMDYGAHLKSEGKSQNAKVVGNKKQSRFLGSNREVRGAVVKLLVQKKKITGKEKSLTKHFSDERLVQALRGLEKEGIVRAVNRVYVLVD
jgi:A/G-specific adenine glycosylase